MQEAVVLRDAQGSQAQLIPSRGAIVSHFSAGGEPILHVDEAALALPDANVRGGIPLLFPIAGKLPDGTYQHAGNAYSMPQHGFARRREWLVVERAADRIRCRLSATDATLAAFPWRFEAELSVLLDRGSLRLELSALNQDLTPMPFHAGFHPYFHVPRLAKSQARVETDATYAFDNVRGTRGAISKIDLNELDLHLEDHTPRGTVLHRGDGLRPIVLEWSGANRLVLWSQRAADFICVEPWTAAGGALATGDPRLPWISPGDRASLCLSIRLG